MLKYTRPGTKSTTDSKQKGAFSAYLSNCVFIMKIVTLHNRVDPAVLRGHIRENLDAGFAKNRGEPMHFVVSGEGNIIEISEPEFYGFLYRIEVDGSKLGITRSEHYVDDVNSLTVESVLNDLLGDVAGKPGTDLLQEG